MIKCWVFEDKEINEGWGRKDTKKLTDKQNEKAIKLHIQWERNNDD